MALFTRTAPHFTDFRAMDQGVNSIGQYATFIDWHVCRSWVW